MKYYVLQPEIAGGTGPKTVFIDRCARPPTIAHWNYQFDGWLGDPILASIGNFIVTVHVKERLESIRASGISFAPVEISKSREFEDLHPNRDLPPFVWLQVHGKGGQDDFGYTADLALVVSERILDILKASGMSKRETSLEDWKGRQAALIERIQQFKRENPVPQIRDHRVT